MRAGRGGVGSWGNGACACWCQFRWGLGIGLIEGWDSDIQAGRGCVVAVRLGLGGSLLMCLRSSLLVRRGGGVCTGTYLLKNFRLRRVVLPDPSTRTTYWSNWRTSIMTPVLSHLVGCWPVLILDSYMVANRQGWKAPGMCGPLLSGFHVTIPECFLLGC